MFEDWDELMSLLRSLDDPVALESPVGFNWVAEEAAAIELTQRLNAAFECQVSTDIGTSEVQDASFLGDIRVPAQRTQSDADICIRASNFGRLVTIACDNFGAFNDAELHVLLAESDRTILIDAFHEGGFCWIPEELLWQPYDGVSDALRDAYARYAATWWTRFFDYL